MLTHKHTLITIAFSLTFTLARCFHPKQQFLHSAFYHDGFPGNWTRGFRINSTVVLKENL